MENRETRVGLAMSLTPRKNMPKKEIESRMGFAGLDLNDLVTPRLVMGYY
jgi:hypothetical protein